ncbi:MAG: aminotransferase class V-fold PLP-dependent enzyme [Verrucomicrobiota bacterium]
MIYLDNNATTQIHPEVVDAMLPFLHENYGNPSAGYSLGKTARRAVEHAREQVASLIDAEPNEIVFTSCGTESINTALRSATGSFPDRRHLITTTAEHSATVQPCLDLERQGYQITRVGIDETGLPNVAEFEETLDQNQPAAVASVIWANNETGVISPIDELANIAREKGILFHTDAVQAVGKIPVSVRETPVHLLSISGHKIHAPKGVGALFINRSIRFSPLIFGGGQESERRSGTENVASIVGLGKAAELAQHPSEKTCNIRDDFENHILSRFDFVSVNGDTEQRLPNTSNLHFRGLDAEAILILLDQEGVCCSPGSACSSGAKNPSAVLTAMGFDEAHAKSSVRFSFSSMNTASEVDEVLEILGRILPRIQAVMPSDDSPVSVH